jgi:hypothetical protein
MEQQIENMEAGRPLDFKPIRLAFSQVPEFSQLALSHVSPVAKNE